MKYKFKEGDRVRIKPAANLLRISIGVTASGLKEAELTIGKVTPGGDIWLDKELCGTPTYDVLVKGDGWAWRIPESFLQESADG